MICLQMSEMSEIEAEAKQQRYLACTLAVLVDDLLTGATVPIGLARVLVPLLRLLGTVSWEAGGERTGWLRTMRR